MKLHTNVIHRSKTFDIEVDQNRLKRSNFLILNFLKIFSKLCTLCKLRVIEVCTRVWILGIWVWMHWVMFHTKFGENRSRPLIFFIVITNFLISMYPRSFLCEEAKIEQHTSSKKKLCEIGEEAIWKSW